jgi:hypothetical protein
MPMQQGGLMCGGTFCPFAPTPIVPCCTTPADVSSGAARTQQQCGLDFSATGSSFYGKSCWQRDQLGIPDQTCSSLTVQAGVSEPGCCTEQGLCGAMNSSDHLGCHYQVGVPAKACGMTEVKPEVSCEPTGVFGVQALVDVAWGGRSGGLVGLTDDGRDKMTFYLMITVDSVDTAMPGPQGELPMQGSVRVCGVELPQFYSTTLCESYKPIFPISIWESTKLPKIDLAGNFGCLHPGCLVTLEAKTVLLGIDLPNPEAPWPTPAETPTLKCAGGKGVQCFPDADDDKQPGVTTTLPTKGQAPPGTGCADSGYDYKAAPLSSSPAAIFGGVRRADRVLLGTRTKLGGSGKISDDCDSAVGTGIAQFVESRAWGCFVQPGTSDFVSAPAGPKEACTSAEAQFLDENMPIYTVLALGDAPDPKLNVVDKSKSKGPLFSLARIGKAGDPITCANVREAKY